MNRRKFVILSGAAVVGTYAGIKLQKPHLPPLPDGPPGNSAVAILRARSYSDDLVGRMLEGARQCGLDARGKRVLLKPNLVEFDSATVINTDASVIAAAVEVFHRLGAAEVRIGEGPGHRRDTLDLASDARYFAAIPKFENLFTDLNRDNVSPVHNFAGESHFYFPNTVLAADLIVSLAKMKTHHWAGATLSMKNFFGLVPGSLYGWPKNKLHYLGIPESVVALNRRFRNTFAIVDGIVGMEGNGPIQGTPKPAGVLVMGRDLVAVDATCCRIMGIDPEKIDYLRMAADLGHVHASRIEQRGESVASVQTNFALIPEYQALRLA
ncbi:MAG TPA: DUF362 domain-containing protein [Bryobacteraceae bacterium]|nr:DUF362 domain-containing protein [Bryobacteraceae bacterium]